MIANIHCRSKLVIDGVFGLKSPIRRIKRKRSPDIKVLSGQIIKLLDSKTLALQLGRKARKRFLENYALEVYKYRLKNKLVHKKVWRELVRGLRG